MYAVAHVNEKTWKVGFFLTVGAGGENQATEAYFSSYCGGPAPHWRMKYVVLP